MKIIGIADTMFARADMASIAIKTIKKSKYAKKVKIIRYTVPGIKDLPVASKKLIEEKKAEIVLALGYVGGAEIDKTCAHEASLGLIQAQLMTNKHILGVFIFEKEGKNEKELSFIIKDRTRKHALNALELLFDKKAMQKKAGTGQRQGSKNAKKINIWKQ